MDVKINIVAILKDKPQGTKLYSPLFGYVNFSRIITECVEVLHHSTSTTFYNDATYMNYKEAEPLLFPSKEMRDWSKFSWKKGDVLISNDGKKEVFFNGFTDDTYSLFKAEHGFEILSDGNTIYLADEDGIATSDYTLETEEAAKTYINTIEERLGGKLNRETLEIEKTQPEFKDGDIAFADYGNRQYVFIVSGKTDLLEGYNSFISLDLSSLTLSMGYITNFFKKDLCKLRLATEEEKKQLFPALEKEGKRWDSEKKEVVDLKPKVELKPFDKVLCRNSKDDTWEADFFARLTRKEIDYTQSGKYLCVGDLWMYCIPYNEETAHLLGTTDEWKGGEQ